MTLRRLAGLSLIAAVSIVVFVTIHELAHLTVGRIVGLPAHFLGPTAVGINASLVDKASGSDLAWMNGVAPFVTAILGFGALAVVVRRGNRLPTGVGRFLLWWAVLGVPYLGFQLTATGAKPDYSGDGTDFAAVFSHLGWPHLLAAFLGVFGVLIYSVAGRVIAPGLAIVEGDGARPRAGADGHRARWRAWVSGAFLLIALALTLAGFVGYAQGRQGGAQSFYSAFLLAIPLAATFAARWRLVWWIVTDWLAPLGVFAVLGILSGVLIGDGDYAQLAFFFYGPLAVAAWYLSERALRSVPAAAPSGLEAAALEPAPST